MCKELGTAGRQKDLYSADSCTVAHDVREWAIANGDNPLLRIALCGDESEHQMPGSWRCMQWKTQGGGGEEHPRPDFDCIQQKG